MKICVLSIVNRSSFVLSSWLNKIRAFVAIPETVNLRLKTRHLRLTTYAQVFDLKKGVKLSKLRRTKLGITYRNNLYSFNREIIGAINVIYSSK